MGIGGTATSRALALLTAAMLLASPLHAQQFCLRGKPKPDCGSMLVLQYDVGTRLNPSPDPEFADERMSVAWDLGVLVNRGDRTALGLTIFERSDLDVGNRHGMRLRWRRWIGQRSSIEVSPGLVFGGSGAFASLRRPSGSLQIAADHGDLIGVTLELQADRYRQGTDLALFFGVRGGSWLAPVIGLGLGTLAAIGS